MKPFRGSSVVTRHWMALPWHMMASWDGMPISSLVSAIAFCHLDLGLDNVDARNHFRYCMFDLDAGIHFNEVEVTVRRHKKFDGTGVDVVHVLHERYGRVADFLAELPRKSKGRRDF